MHPWQKYCLMEKNTVLKTQMHPLAANALVASGFQGVLSCTSYEIRCSKFPQYSEFDTKPQGVAFRGCRGCIQGVAFSAGGCIRGLHFCQGVAFRGCISPRGLHLGIKMPSRSLAHGEQGTCWAVTMYGEIVDL